MRPHTELRFSTRTHTGLARFQNEDSVALVPDMGIVILADGMGGYNAGEVASGMATEQLKSDLVADLSTSYRELARRRSSRLHQLLQSRIGKVNAAIFDAAETRPEYAGMGTTLLAVLFREGELTVAHIGDSRLYRLRGTELLQMTRDHSLVQDHVDAGLVTPHEAKSSPNRNLLTRALGVDPLVDAEIHDHEVQRGDLYLLCSDGLSDMLDDELICELLQSLQSGSDDIDSTADKLIDCANEAGGHDNVSVVLVQVEPATGSATTTTVPETTDDEIVE